MTTAHGRLNGHGRLVAWAAIAATFALAAGVSCHQRAESDTRIRERLTAVETVIPRIDAKLKALEAGQRVMSKLLMERLPK